jgi:hypothetical protein
VATSNASVASISYGDGAAPPPSQAPGSDLELAMGELAQAMGAYQAAEEYYDGTRAEVFATVRLRRAMARTGTAFKFNFAKKAVQAVAERLEIASVDSTTPGAKALIDDLWKDNKLARQSKQIMRRASEYGDAYVIVWPSADTDWDGVGIKNVDVFYNSPMSVRLFYDAENPQVKAFAIKQWVLAAQKKVRVDLYYPDRIEKYVSKAGVLHPKAEDMVPFYDTADDVDPQDVDAGPGWPRPNPFGEIPVFHFRNDDPYGCPEHEGFYGTQDSLRKLVLSHMAGVDYQAFPQRYALADGTADSSELAAGDEDLFQYALDTGATSRVGDPQSQLSADPGSVWWLQGVKGVGQFDPADPATFTDPMTLYLRFGALITDTPLSRLDPTGAVESGESRRAANEPFTKKIEDRQESYGDTWCEMVVFALKVLDIDDAEVTVRWKSAGAIDDQAGWETLLAKLNAGLPDKQAFMEAGYTQDQVDEWFGDGDDLQLGTGILVKIGTALGSLAPAVAAGVIDDQQIQRLIVALLGDIMGPPALPPEPAPLPTIPPQAALPAGMPTPQDGPYWAQPPGAPAAEGGANDRTDR